MIGRSSRNRGNFLGGVMFEADLTPRFSVEIDGIWRTLRLSEQRDVVLTWQFPVLLKYRLPVGKINPFIQAGPSFRASGNLNAAHPSKFGVTAAIGTEHHWKSLRVAPALRYTRWKKDNPPYSWNWHTVPDQLEFVVGFSFGRKKP